MPKSNNMRFSTKLSGGGVFLLIGGGLFRHVEGRSPQHFVERSSFLSSGGAFLLRSSISCQEE